MVNFGIFSSGLLSLGGLIGQQQPVLSPESNIDGVNLAARTARQVIKESSLSNLITIGNDDTPEGQMEYYSDCSSDGMELTFIGMYISHAFKNIEKGSKASLVVRVGDQPINEHVKTDYPGSTSQPAGLPRMTLYGDMLLDTGTPSKDVQNCFLNRHPDAKWWLPEHSLVHDSYWAKFNITGIHFIGGFGDRAYIGDIPLDVYRAAL